MIDRSKQTAVPTPSSAALRFKRNLRAGASVLALAVAGFGAGMVQPAFAADYTINGGRTETVPGDHDSGWTVAGNLNVGPDDNGTLIIKSGAQVNVTTHVFIGSRQFDGPGEGTVTVDGAGSKLTATSSVNVGFRGIGTLNITNGGSVISTAPGLSSNVGGTVSGASRGTVTVDGTGSTWTTTKLDIGFASKADNMMTVRNGGAVFSAEGQIGVNEGNGAVTIEGQGSKWTISGAFGVGRNGTGTLTIKDGGTVSAKTTSSSEIMELGGGSNNRGTLNIGAAAGDAPAGAGYLEAYSVSLADAVINFNHTDDDYIFSLKLISGINFVSTINQLYGTTILTADNSGFTGILNINGGELSVGGENNIGASSVALNFDGGVLQITGTTFKKTDRTINWGARGGGFDIADAANIFTVGQNLGAGSIGSLTKRGDGKLVLIADNGYSGGTILDGGTLSVSRDANLGDASGGLSFDGGALQITDTMSSARSVALASGGGTILVDDTKTATFSGVFANAGTAKGSFTKAGAGTLVLTANNKYTGGTTVSGGILQLGDGTTDGSILGAIDLNGGDLVVANQGATVLDGNISGTGSVTQNGAGKLTLSGNNSYGDTYLNAGVISVEQEENLGTGALNFDGGTLQVTGTHFKSTNKAINWGAGGGAFDIVEASNEFALSNVFTGTGGLTKIGDGMLVLSGDSSGFKGDTHVNAGGLRLDGGKLGDGTGTVTVASGGSLGGHGIVGGNTTVAGGGLFGQTGQRLDFLKDLTLNAGSNVDVTLYGPASANELFHVSGNLIVNGTLSVNQNSTVELGLYRIFQSDNPLTDNGMHLAANSNSNYELQIVAGDGQVNLINTGGLTLNFWNGTTTQPDGTIHGGNGIWNGANQNWTDKDGQVNGSWANDNFAVFQGTGGTVTIANGFTPIVSGMQFFVDGYKVENGTITLGGPENWINVGDGSLQGANYVATIASVLDGQNGMIKVGYGTLNLTGQNTYIGDTTVNEGTLELSGNGSINQQSNIVLAGTQFDHGDLLINKDQNFTLLNKVSGIGSVTKDGTGTTVFAGNNTFSGGLTVKGGTAQAGIADHAFGSGNVSVKGGAKLDLNDFNETVGSLLGETSGDGTIDLGSGTLTLNQNLHGDFSGTISGTGGLTKNGDGDLVLYGENAYAGATTVNRGDLVQGAAGGFSSASAFAVAKGASIQLGGFETTIAGLANGGDVVFGGMGGTVLNIAGDYAGNDGTLHMSAVLGNDNSLADRMNVSGNTSGTSKIDITNRKGFGDKTVNGIEIINVGGTSDGVFTLNGDYTTRDGKAGIMTDSAYAYTLQKGSGSGNEDGNWYLVSQYEKPGPGPDCHDTDSCPVPPERFSPAAPVYETYNATLQALNKLPTLQQRVGERYVNADNNASASARTNQPLAGETDSKAIWGRIEGAHNRLEVGSTAGTLHQDINTVILQAGVDGQFYEGENGRLIAGITGQYGKARSNIDNRTGDGSGSIDTQGWGLGATATWYGNSGFYVDAQAQANWYDSDLGVDAVNPTLANGNKGFGYALSLEAGQRIVLDQNWSLTPQAQLMFSSVDFDTFKDSYGARISNRDGDSLTGRLGLAASYANAWKGEDGLMVNTSVYGIANLYQEFLGDARMNYAGTHMATDSDGTWGGIGAGGTYAWADNKYAIYGEGSINTSLNHFADSYALKGNLGFKVKW
ncbi:MAG TPA: autotransporter outer membrane beta-barrel domain-containing protein [Ochrobactrum intermedium]|uniref:Autotransporter outer membrane beta-barrel domain-containing protein n=3 Tax=Brucella intermedia TaxID=94625 RepID=A0A7V6TYQ3_9HYPH|nr:autotransporter outer membrane beta-barrel domain-containing protein [Brucella intermedia]HHV67161.1 autotransporter outer membrane beta-barrel domain-containing protein [Brucella intermedia]